MSNCVGESVLFSFFRAVGDGPSLNQVFTQAVNLSPDKLLARGIYTEGRLEKNRLSLEMEQMEQALRIKIVERYHNTRQFYNDEKRRTL